MYVCICNAFTEKQVARALGRGARRPACVYRELGCAPQCGKCVPVILSMVRTFDPSHPEPAPAIQMAS